MVTCEGESVHSGFRLGAHAQRAQSSPPRPCGSVSSVSLYKQKIDALFDDNRSVASLGQYGANLTSNLTRQSSKVSSIRRTKPTIFKNEDDVQARNRINNSVQDRIERMFAEMAVDSKGPLADPIGVHTFSVDYLGSTPLHEKVTSLSGLQIPLKNLYFAYRKSLRQKAGLSGQLEISKSGLKVRYQGDKGDLEQLNPFPTIAVWSAVKFVVQASEKENNNLSYAFLPLITDPDNIDKYLLFKTLEPADQKYILSHNENAHSPLFAVVMRKIGVAKQLECHGFVCQTSEDAIVVAATLYKSLMSHMSRQGHDENRTKNKLKNRNGVSCMSIASSMTHPDVPTRPSRKKRSTSSLSGDSDIGGKALSVTESFRGKVKSLRNKKRLSQCLPPPPPPPCIAPNNAKTTVEQVKAKLDSIKNINDSSGNESKDPPKNMFKESIDFLNSQPKNNNSNSSNESSVRSKVSEKIELFTELEKRRNLQRPPTLPPPIPVKPIETKQEEATKEPLRRNQSGRNSMNDSGDILTKIAIPRSGSFLNAGGLTRYKSIGQRNNGKKGGGSPLGFNELFNEFRVQENLHSMDEIMNAIIDAEGMSFNDLKPIYKEFLLKLAVTLTKDELFQHSKSIMKKQKKKILRRNSTVQNKRKKMFKGANGLRMVFRMPFGKEIKKKDERKPNALTLDPKSFEFQSLASNMKSLLHSESSVSTSSYDLRQFHPKESGLPPPKRQTVKKRNSKRSEKIVQVSKRNGKVLRPGERTSTSEDSDFLTMSGRLGCQNRHSSSGYVSCSECESESCVDRCYCSLKDDCKSKCYCSAEMKDVCQNAKKNVTRGSSYKDRIGRDICCYDPNCDYSCCGCDTESCADSAKCYCRASFPPPPLRTPPVMKKSKNTVKSSKSLEYLKNPSQKLYSEKLRQAFDDCYYEPLKPRQEAFRPRSNSMLGPKTYGERIRCEERSKKSYSTDNLALDYELFLNKGKETSYRRNMQRLTVRSTGGQDALSVKKSAEMAALFADVRLSQRTDVRNLLGSNSKSKGSTRNLFSSRNGMYTSSFNHVSVSRKTSLEDTLGYLP